MYKKTDISSVRAQYSVEVGNDRVVSDGLLEFIADHETLDIQYKEELGRYIDNTDQAVTFSTLSKVEFSVLAYNWQSEKKACRHANKCRFYNDGK